MRASHVFDCRMGDAIEGLRPHGINEPVSQQPVRCLACGELQYDPDSPCAIGSDDSEPQSGMVVVRGAITGEEWSEAVGASATQEGEAGGVPSALSAAPGAATLRCECGCDPKQTGCTGQATYTVPCWDSVVGWQPMWVCKRCCTHKPDVPAGIVPFARAA